MEDRNAYFEKVGAELAKWDEEIRRLKDNAASVAEDIETQYYEQFEDLIAMRELAGQKLEELKESEEGMWTDLRAAMEAALRNIKKSHDFLMMHFA